MVSRVIGAIAIAISLASVFGEPSVRLNERHLRALSEDQLRSQQQQQRQQDEGDGRYGWEDSVPGVPGRDYPNLTSIPETSFSCVGKTAGGYYADVETRCQVFHVCSTQGLKSSFLCPSGSIFNQRHFVCDWWYDFICEQALELYSLNDALNDPNSSSDSPTSSDDVDRYNQLPLTPVQFNSIAAGSNADLSLASSGYTNNLRDEANLIYEDYNNPKTAEKPATPVATSAIPDNYSDARRKESTRSYEEQQQQQQQQHRQQQPIYRRRPSQGPDNVPRGFSKPPSSNNDDTAREFKRGDQGPGFFVNNGLSDTFRDQNYQLAAENNNFIDNTNYYKSSDTENNNYNSRSTISSNNNYNNKPTTNENNNFNVRNTPSYNENYNSKVSNNQNANVNARNVPVNNDNYNVKIANTESTNFHTRNVAINNNDNYNGKVNNADGANFNTRNAETNGNNGNFNDAVYTENNANNNVNDYQNFYQNAVQYPLPQENNNYDNNFNQNFVNSENQNENYYNTIRIYSTEYTNKYSNNGSNFNSNYDNSKNNFNTVNYNSDSNYNSNNNNQNYNSNANYQENNNDKNNNNNNNNNNNDNNYKNTFQSDYQKPIHVESTTADYNYRDDQFETTINPDFLINSGASEEEVDRLTQREVDSVDLKRQRPPSAYTRQYSDTYTSTPGFLIREETSWRDDLSTSSSGSQSPPFPPERNYESTPTLQRPEETTTPVTISTRRPKEAPKYLGRRPNAGLVSGAGNGLPGANKNLAASNAITGKPIDETSTNSIPSVDDGYSTYRPPQGFTATPNQGQESYNDAGYRPEGQYWNDGKQSWNDAAKYNNGRY